MITKDDLDQLFEWGSSVEFPLKISPKFTGRGKDFDGDDWRGYWLKMTRRMTNIRKSYMPEHIVKIHENPDILYSAFVNIASGADIKPHRDPEVYLHKYKRIQIPLVVPEREKCYMVWDDNKKYYWVVGVPQCWVVMDHTHSGANYCDEDAKFLFLDVKLDTEVIINN